MLWTMIVAWAVEPLNLDDGVALDGYDPVAYFTQAAPVLGTAEHTATHDGAVYRFSSADHLAAFEASPAAYLPAFGGYCAWAVSRGRTADIDPAAWTVVEGRLYLNYSPGIQEKWRADVPGNIAKGEENWPKLLDGTLPAE